jgi:hypothetical protein
MNDLAVPVEAQPAKIIHRLLRGAWLHARRIDVLDSQDDLTAGRSGGQPGDQEGARIADVLGTGR